MCKSEHERISLLDSSREVDHDHCYADNSSSVNMFGLDIALAPSQTKCMKSKMQELDICRHAIHD